MPRILLGVCGSIAAFRAADIASQLVKAGHDVHVVMTEAATRFIAPLTLQALSRNPVVTSLWDEKEDWRPGHIELADSADLLLVAPATATTLARFAQGLADDALSAIHLATRAPLLIAPAMNGKMWAHPATRANTELLTQRGAHFIGPDEGMLACGYEGQGRIMPTEDILSAVATILKPGQPG